ncbi:hypothetical protein P171DRAFT_492330 [Karstenula rhodostoma CBS 690.94]|uniref:Secreted protein n=1 Tax=Karstenula rhodostoma CBS 690.94 TaxID=1392251 RepID=A0A9P4P2S0_9PLEO|nr:hypothetical protein P171DRAFT_492330 [Karstenula rhodostoma CBS 690.94]
MFSKTIIAATFTSLFITSAIGAAIAPAPAARAALIAPDPDAACNCPNNCQHSNGESCSFYRDGNHLDGICQHTGEGGRLLCVA